ncbi:MAG: putative peptidoglycan binding domain [Herbinix sp.]|nr:putative peptidoglycan binding domain [Herbinix sp.]
MTEKNISKNVSQENRSNNIRSKKKKNKRRKRLFYGSVGVITPVLLLYLFLSFYYHNHFYNNAVINGVSVSNMVVNQAEDAINAQVKSYLLTLEERNDVSEQINGENIGLHTVFDGSLKELLAKQNGLAWPISLFKTHVMEINTMLEYDESLLKIYFDRLKCFDEANVEEPVNAHISEYGKNGYEIVKESLGTKVYADKLYEIMKESIINLEPTISLEEAECYDEPKINSQDPGLAKALDKMNKIAGAKITYEFGKDTEILDGNQISKWLTLDDNYDVTLDKVGVKEYVDYIGKTYNSFGRVRTFQTSYGDIIKVKGGDYGWWLDRPTEVAELTELLLKGEQLTREPAYFQIAQQYGPDDIGDTYVEVNLTAQHLFFYKEGKLVLESDFVSGNLSKEFGTPTGTYPIQYKENDATLVGEDYATPVKYWMPFNGNIGFHDATWREEFGKDFYINNGSHGCINMPPANAKKMFENIKRGVAVVVYELEGTESFDIEKDKEEKEKDKANTETTTASTTVR